MTRILLGLLCLLFTLPYSGFSQDNFPGCPGHFVILNPQAGGASNLSSVTTSDISLTTIGNTGVELNALAFNPVDNYLYAMSDPLVTGFPSLYRINSSGVPTFLTNIVSPPSGVIGFFVGDIDQNGIYYFPAIQVTSLIPISYQVLLGRLDLTAPLGLPSVTPTYTPINLGTFCQASLDSYFLALITAALTGGPLPSGGIQDWAFNPNDNKLWSYFGVESVVFSFDPVTGNATCYPTLNPPLTEFGGIFFDQAGLMYGFEVDAGATYKVDVSGCPLPPCGALTAGTSNGIDLRGDAASCPWPNIPLSVELVDFTATGKRFSVDLNWTTETETNNSHFVVERSGDGFDFTPIGTVQGVGNSTSPTSYSFEDDNPMKGENYYQLRSVNLNNEESLTGIRIVNFNSLIDFVAVFPNPVRNNATIAYEEALESESTLYIHNMLGQLVKEMRLSPGVITQEINFDGLANGQYLIQMTINNQQLSQKIVVLRN